MNTAPGHITNHVAEDDTSDPRHGMKLITSGSSKGRSRVRIALHDNLLPPKSMFKGRQRMASENRDLPENEEFSVPGSVVVLAALAGLAIGFFVGRRRDG